ncbi:MAG: MBL fold metallo-hydrolase [Betaproteobacteria bacterium]|nr:MBL fold metallo-hydrolase [Betaproteobacteria bacterium]
MQLTIKYARILCSISTAVLFLLCAVIPSFVSAQETLSREIWKAGDMTVTVIQDLPSEMAASIFSGPASEEEKSKYFTNGKAEAGINAFLLRAGGKIVLFDSGTGTLFKSPGKLPETLVSLGIKPEDVDFVLLTHMHMDHIGGLLREEKRAFPKAKVLVSKPELESWLTLAEKDPSNVNAAKVKAVVAAYGVDIQPFVFGGTPLPGIKALDASGHTPGHTVYQLTANGKSLLIVGDIIHSMPLQFALPDECASYDMNPPQAVLARKRIFALAAKEGMQLAGIHFPFANAVGTVKQEGKGWKFKQTQ